MQFWRAELDPIRSRSGAALSFALLAVLAGACGDDGGAPATTDDDAGAGGSTIPAPNDDDEIDESVLAACPQTTTLLETTDWTGCLEGKRLSGVEPFSNKPCALRFGANGAVDYLIDGAVAISVPDRSAWGPSSYGTYQNDASGASRIFLAGMSPNLAAVEGEPRVTDYDISLFAFAGKDDTVAVNYLDAALSRKTYNCTVDAL